MPRYVYLVEDSSSGGCMSVKGVYDNLTAALEDVKVTAEERDWTLEYDGWTAYDPEDEGNALQVEEKVVSEGQGLVDKMPVDTGEIENPDESLEEDYSSMEDPDDLEDVNTGAVPVIS